MDYISTGVAATVLTAGLRVFEALIRKSSFFKRTTVLGDYSDIHNLMRRISTIENTLREMRDGDAYADVEYRVRQLEIEALRHEWRGIIRRGGENGND